MTHITFEAYSASLKVEVGHDAMLSESLHYEVHLSRKNFVFLATGEKFDRLRGEIVVRMAASDVDPRFGPAGALHFLPADPHAHSAHAPDSLAAAIPPSYCAEVLVSPTQFEAMAAAARAGHIPSEIRIETLTGHGLEYDKSTQEGRVKTWDNKSSPLVKLFAASLSVPLVKGSASP